MIIRIPTRVKNLEHKEKLIRAYPKDRAKPDSEVIHDTITLGWYVHFEGSYESLCVGVEKPEWLTPGTEVDIIIAPRRGKGR